MGEWKQLPHDRMIQDKKGYSVIIPSVLPKVIPLDCPACGLLMRDHSDVLSFNAHECCSECRLDLYTSVGMEKTVLPQQSGQIVPHLDN